MIQYLVKFLKSNQKVYEIARRSNVAPSTMQSRLCREAKDLKRNIEYPLLLSLVDNVDATPKQMRKERVGWLNAIEYFNKTKKQQ